MMLLITLALSLATNAFAFNVGASALGASALRTNTPMMRVASGPDPQQKNVVIPKKNVWVTFANAADCKPGEIISGFRQGQEIAIACTKNGKLFALSNRLPPIGQPATTSFLVPDKPVIVEPITATAFDLRTGKVDGTWCPSPIGRILFSWLTQPSDALVFPVRKQGNKVQVLIDVNAKAKFEQAYWRGVLDAQGKVDGGYY